MDIVIESLMKQFQVDHDLEGLAQDEAFEAFAGFCVLSSFYESDFASDSFRMGGGNDYGIDVCGILVNGSLLHDKADIEAATDQAKQLDVHIIVIQAKTSQKFETKVISDLADNLSHVVVKGGELPYPASPDVENFRASLEAVYRNIAKFSGWLRACERGPDVRDFGARVEWFSLINVADLGAHFCGWRGIAGSILEGWVGVRAGENGGVGERQCWDVVAGGVGPGSDRSADRVPGVGDDAGESGDLDVADHEGGAVVVLLDHEVGMRFGRCEERADRGKVAHLAVPSDVVSDVGEGEHRLQGPVGARDGVGGDPVG